MGTDLPGPRINNRHRAVPRPLQPPCRARLRRPGNHRTTAPGARSESPQNRPPPRPQLHRRPGGILDRTARPRACQPARARKRSHRRSRPHHRTRTGSAIPRIARTPVGNTRRGNRGRRACTAHTAPRPDSRSGVGLRSHRGMTGRSSRGGCCIDMQSSRWCIGYDRAANDARPRWINARRPAVRRSSSGLHDALAECSRSDIMGGCCATYCCATPFGTSVLSPRQDVVR